MDEKAKANILSISPSELKQIKNYEISSDIWKKLKEIYQSKGPAGKTSLEIPDSAQNARLLYQ